MAEYVKGRFHAARVGVTMAILGLLAGLGIKNEQQPPATTTIIADPAAAQVLANNSIGSAQIKNHSLLFSDMKLHQVPSYKEYKLFTSVENRKWLKLDTANLVHKLDVFDKASADSRFLKLDEAAGIYEKMGDAANTFLKLDGTALNAHKIDNVGLDQLMQGRGQVITGNTVVGNSDSNVFVLIGLLQASAKSSAVPNSADVTLTNTSSTDTLLVNGDGNKNNTTIAVPPGKSETFALGDGSVRTLQVVIQGGTQAITLGFSSFTGGVRTVIGQAVVGSF